MNYLAGYHKKTIAIIFCLFMGTITIESRDFLLGKFIEVLQTNNIKKVTNFIKQVHINVTTEDGYNLLHIAIDNKSISMSIIELLIENGINVNLQSKDGYTPLHFAIATKSVQITSLLIQSGANLNLQTNEGLAPLHVAIVTGEIEIATLLIKAGAHVNIQHEGISLLCFAIIFNSIKIVQLLLDSNTNYRCTINDDLTALDCCKTQEMYDLLKSKNF